MAPAPASSPTLLECPGCKKQFTVEQTPQLGVVVCQFCKRKIVLQPASRTRLFNQSLARALIEQGVVTQTQLEDAITAQQAASTETHVVPLSDILIKRNLVTPAQIKQVLGVNIEMPPPPLPGYEILARIASGGMGTVYRGIHLASGKDVAVKVLSPRLLRHKAFVERFHREARVAIELDHPHIVKGYDEGATGAHHYFVMEFVQGKSVQRVLAKRGRFGERRSLFISRQIVTALAYAHSRGLVHRDIKPDNILLMRDGTAKLLDYGLVKLADDPALVHLTASDEIVGTPHYISPEQAAGEEVDIRSDIYSLGATLYHMVTGVPPFQAATGAEVISMHLYGAFVPPGQHVTDLSAQTGELIQRMMARRPGERVQTPGELLDAFERCLGGVVAAASDLGEDESDEQPAVAPSEAAAPARPFPLIPLAGLCAVTALFLCTLYAFVVPSHVPGGSDTASPAVQAELEAQEALNEILKNSGNTPKSEDLASLPVRYPGTLAALSALRLLQEAKAPPASESEAVRLEALLPHLPEASRRALELRLASEFSRTEPGKRMAALLRTEEAELARREKQQRLAAEKHARAAAEKRRNDEAKKHLDAALAEEKTDLRRAALQRLLADAALAGAPALAEAKARLKEIDDAETAHQAREKLQQGYEKFYRSVVAQLAAQQRAEAQRTVAEFLGDKTYAPYHKEAQLLAADIDLILSFTGCLLDGLEKQAGTEVKLRMENGDLHAGTLLGVEREEDPRFRLRSRTGKEISRYIRSLHPDDRIGFAAAGAPEPPWRGRLLAAYCHLFRSEFDLMEKDLAAIGEDSDRARREALFRDLRAAVEQQGE